MAHGSIGKAPNTSFAWDILLKSNEEDPALFLSLVIKLFLIVPWLPGREDLLLWLSFDAVKVLVGMPVNLLVLCPY